MVERKKRGELRDYLEDQSRDYLKELCYLLDLKRGGKMSELIDRIVLSEFDFAYVDQKARFLSFGLLMLGFQSAKQLRGTLKELGIPTLSRKWDNMVEIIKSEEVEPMEILGMLTMVELENLYLDLFEEGAPATREEISRDIVDVFGINWMEEETSKGFIMMAMKDDAVLNAALRVIKNECQRFDIRAIRIDDIQNSNLITQEVIDEIKNSNILLVDLTYERPNVYYELGYGHGIGKDPKNIVLMAKKGTTLHFDIRNMRTIIWKDPDDLKVKLRRRLSSIQSR